VGSYAKTQEPVAGEEFSAGRVLLFAVRWQADFFRGFLGGSRCRLRVLAASTCFGAAGDSLFTERRRTMADAKMQEPGNCEDKAGEKGSAE